MNEFLYLIRRELWEHRALYVVPIVFAGVLLLSVTVGIVRGTTYVGSDHIAHQLQFLSPGEAGQALSVMTLGAWLLFSIVSAFVVTFYMLDALYGDRKDRSVLFWKSLPIGDTETVLSKLAVATLVMPAIVIAAVLVTMLALLVILSVAVAFSGANPFTLLWSELPVFRIVGSMISIELTRSLWFLPFTGWLLLASATAKRTPFLLAALVPLGLIFAEKLAFNTQWLGDTVDGYVERFFRPLFGDISELRLSPGEDGIEMVGDLGGFGAVFDVLTDPVLLVGLVVGVAFIMLTIQMRKRRIDID
jgi:ABC-2 type transport system permease protein